MGDQSNTAVHQSYRLAQQTASQVMKKNQNKFIYREPHASRAARKVLTRSTASLRGLMVAMLPAYEWPREIHYESALEYRFLCLMLIRPDVFDLREQAPGIRYRGQDNAPKTHFFDFLVTFTNGERVAFAIKPLDRVIKLGFVAELEIIRNATPKHFADKVVLVTEQQLDRKAATAAARQLMRNRPSLTEAAA
ncbi:hypothetical protein CLV80_11730 [Yoonia maritima]|uniref:TnsA endonuclease-like protein n=2 Tax=Yoonia maritima TaxID=1435347 RepID=A0A2T0VTN0_9RHOB|nr:hypothetical protein CLV80_11730 [Yoonia maritima]